MKRSVHLRRAQHVLWGRECTRGGRHLHRLHRLDRRRRVPV